MKNSGSQFHAEIANKSFMDDLRELVKLTSHEKVKEKILELIQVWAHAFRNNELGRPVQDTLNIMRAEGFKFPQLKESDAMFTADSAPQWADADNCARCGTQFSLVVRKHHCRACGNIFCGKCSAKQSAIPKFGIEKEVRVCDGCFDKLNKPQSGAATKLTQVDSPVKSGQKSSAPPGKSEQELQEEEELQLALAISQSEEEDRKEREKRYRTTSLPMAMNSSRNNATTSPATGRRSEPGSPKLPIDSELSRYLDRNYWEQKPWANANNNNDSASSKQRSSSPAPSAPRNNEILTETAGATQQSPSGALLNGEESNEIDNFLASLRSAIEIFVNRMNSNKLRGRPIANDSAVQSLFLNITNMHSQLLQYMQEQDDQRLHLEALQDKLSQIRDARAALDALREEHQEKLRIEAEEAERIRQVQMAQKLEIMRKKKQEYLQYQRQIALQRIQEQEAAMKTLQQTKYWSQGQAPVGALPYGPQQAYPQPVVGGPPPAPMGVPPQHIPPQYPPGAGPPPPYPHANPYPVYNMQAINQALPPQAGAPPGSPAQHAQPPPQPMPQPPPQQHVPQPPTSAVNNVPVHTYNPAPAPAPVPPPQPAETKPEVNEAPLISFD